MKVKKRAVELANDMQSEDGVSGAVRAFFKQLPKRPQSPPASVQSGFMVTCWNSIKKCFGNS